MGTNRTVLLQRTLRIVLPLAAVAVLVLPGAVFLRERGGWGFLSEAPNAATFAGRAFPLFGLYAFTLVWGQLVVGTNVAALRRVFPRTVRFHRWQGGFALLFALAHPLLLLTAVGWDSFLARDFVATGYAPFVLTGQIALLLLLCTAGTALLHRIPWLRARWRFVHYANYAVFVLAWVHAWNLGTDTQSTELRYLWWFFGVTGILTTAFRLLRAVRRPTPSLEIPA